MRLATVTRAMHFLFIGIAAVLMAACGAGTSNVPPTQTPIFVVVTGDTPVPTEEGDAAPTPTPDLSATSDLTQSENGEGAADSGTPSVFPTPITCGAGVVEQPFENGRMFWVGRTTLERCKTEHSFIPGTGEIWVAIFDEDEQGGEWLAFVDNFDEDTEAISDPSLEPPEEELFQPVRGFGKVWRERLSDEQREALGWATFEEVSHVTDYRYDAGGFVNDDNEFVERPGQHTLTSLGGETFFFDESTLTFDYIPAE